jgi:hypothetical protein
LTSFLDSAELRNMTKGELVDEARWIRQTLKEVEDELARRKPGPDPRDDADPDAYLGVRP